MGIELYSEVALLQDFPEEGLRVGDIATLVDFVGPAGGGEPGAVLEIFNVLGESIGVAAVPASAIAPLRSDQVPAARPLQTAAEKI